VRDNARGKCVYDPSQPVDFFLGCQSSPL
jgi:hypothetical protein